MPQKALILEKVVPFAEANRFLQELTNFKYGGLGSYLGDYSGYGNGWTQHLTNEALNGEAHLGSRVDIAHYPVGQVLTDPQLRLNRDDLSKNNTIPLTYFSLKVNNGNRFDPYTKLFTSRLERWTESTKGKLGDTNANNVYYERGYPFVTINRLKNDNKPGHWRGWNTNADTVSDTYEKARIGVEKKSGPTSRYGSIKSYEPYAANTYSMKGRYADNMYPQLVLFNTQKAELSGVSYTPVGDAYITSIAADTRVVKANNKSTFQAKISDSFTKTEKVRTQTRTSNSVTIGTRLTKENSSFNNHKWSINANISAKGTKSLEKALPDEGGKSGSGIGGDLSISGGYENTWGESVKDVEEMQRSETNLKETSRTNENTITINNAQFIREPDGYFRYGLKRLHPETVMVATLESREYELSYDIIQAAIIEDIAISKHIKPNASMFYSNTSSSVTQKDDYVDDISGWATTGNLLDLFERHSGLFHSELDDSYTATVLDENGNEVSQSFNTLKKTDRGWETYYGANVVSSSQSEAKLNWRVLHEPSNSALVNLEASGEEEIGDYYDGGNKKDIVRASKEGDDWIDTGGGADKVIAPTKSYIDTGKGSDDVILTELSNLNTVITGSGNDKVIANGSSNHITTESGSDNIIDKGTKNTIYIGGDKHADRIRIKGANSLIKGFDPGEDTLAVPNRSYTANTYGSGGYRLYDPITGEQIATILTDIGEETDLMSKSWVMGSVLFGGALRDNLPGDLISNYFSSETTNEDFVLDFIENGALERTFYDADRISSIFIKAVSNEEFQKKLARNLNRSASALGVVSSIEAASETIDQIIGQISSLNKRDAEDAFLVAMNYADSYLIENLF